MTDNGNPDTRRIRELRKAAGLSQERLARAVDCSTAYVKILERGYSPDPGQSPVLARIVDYLNDNGSATNAPEVKTPGGHSRHGSA